MAVTRAEERTYLLFLLRLMPLLILLRQGKGDLLDARKPLHHLALHLRCVGCLAGDARRPPRPVVL